MTGFCSKNLLQPTNMEITTRIPLPPEGERAARKDVGDGHLQCS